VDRAAFQAELNALRTWEKAHTGKVDEIAAARRLPMVQADTAIPLTDEHGPVSLLKTFEGRRQLIAYYFMWWGGHSAGRHLGSACSWPTRDLGFHTPTTWNLSDPACCP